ncbi:MAG: hypothetical protein AAGJ18_15550 [Bacteroidota bacterium]
MKNTVLLSIDVFNPNQTLLKYGVFTARNLGAKLLLFDAHFKTVVVSGDMVTSGSAAINVIDRTDKVEEAKRKLATIYKHLNEEWHHTRAKLVTDPVPAWQGNKEMYLLEEIEKEKPLMILAEVKSNFNLINELFGTAETKLAEEAECPVLLVPEGVAYSEVTDIHYLLEREKPIEEVTREVLFLKEMADNFANKSTINLLYYFGDDKEIAEQELALKKSVLLNELQYDKLVFLNMSDHDIETAIHQNTKKYATDIFAFPSRDKSFIGRLISKDNTKRLILQSKIPVLVF